MPSQELEEAVTFATLGDEFRREMDLMMEVLKESVPAVVGSIDTRVALPADAADVLADFREPLPRTGCGARESIERLIDLNERAGGNAVGPKSFHFVIGGSTPAALAADMLANAYEAIPYTWVLTPVGVEMEIQALNWLKEMFGLPVSWPAVMVTGATMANFVCLAAGRQWWGEQHGVDVSEVGLAGLPQMPVLTSGFVHAATLKCLATQGVGRGNVRQFCRDDFGRLDIDAMEAALVELDGQPAMVVVNAGEVNAGEFDPVEDMIDLARQHNCWIHVDGAFGLFARISPRTAHFVRESRRRIRLRSMVTSGSTCRTTPATRSYATMASWHAHSGTPPITCRRRMTIAPPWAPSARRARGARAVSRYGQRSRRTGWTGIAGLSSIAWILRGIVQTGSVLPISWN